MRFLVLLFLLLLTACADRNVTQVFPTAGGEVERMLVQTNRAIGADGVPGWGRDMADHFLQVGVSVPPDRAVGSFPISYLHPDPQHDFVLQQVAQVEDRTAFLAEMRHRLAALPRGGRELVIFVHGYNTSFADGVFRMAQVQRDFGLEAVSVAFSWPTAARTLGYSHDRESMLYSRDSLERLIRDAGASGADTVLLVGHSMGAMLIMETLRQMAIAEPGLPARLVDGVVLMAPDIDVDVFNDQARRIDPLPQPFYIFTSARDSALRVSGQINVESTRLGMLEDPARVADQPVTLVDVTNFPTTLRDSHLVAISSPALIQLLANRRQLEETFRGTAAGNTLPEAFDSVRRATRLVLSPITP
ncbi:alpha/beta hydrolase [Pseudooceanicola nanhaiensis]|uniref:alpha/beta hydrolase n=1 Tax=Pseudooceanicola nanhaiensis TaxID=375761 RepID=UPI001CD52E21|nr:alpha/beta fold hydrolase [Pseudooceanicola nanhaiensis]MCA0920261.1 alpha/beta fold hydrolase [Pseudooceanicola nanhaiensis]